MRRNYTHWLFFTIIAAYFIIIGTSCANIVPPGGGPRDSLPPRLITATPADSTTTFKGNRITLNFDEYIEVENAFENVIVSPTQQNTPTISNKLRTISIRLRDTLEENTTYSIDFGNAIKDINEGNVYKNFTYVFSTGNTIAQNVVRGNVVLAETGEIDTTLIVVLHRNAEDSAVANERPRYVTRLDGQGNFQFNNLPEGRFAIYAIPSGFSRRYDDTTKPFAFLDTLVATGLNTKPVTLYAYALPKTEVAPATENAPANNNRRGGGARGQQEKQLSYSTNLEGGRLDLLQDLKVNFVQRIATYDSNKITLTDKNFRRLPNYRIVADTNRTLFTYLFAKTPNTAYNLIFDKGAFTDTAGTSWSKIDTIEVTTKKEEEYGSVKLTFLKFDPSKNPVLQIVQNNKVIESSPVTQRVWQRKLFTPGEYALRILYDTNKNNQWDPGKFFGNRRQPEIVRDLKITLTVRGNWDNEKEISL